MDLTIGSLNFCVGSSGSTRLLDPTKPDPSASKTKTIIVSESSVGSSSEVNSPVSFATTENKGGKIKELDETMETLDIGGIVDKRALVKRTPSPEVVVSPATYTNYASLSPKQQKKTIMQTM
jgi:hypothetical protein